MSYPTQVVEAVEALEDIRATLFDLQSDAGEGHPTPMAENAPGSPVAAVTLGCQPGRHPPPHKISLPPSL